MPVNILLRRGTAAEWTASNPTLLEAEVGLETDSKKLKVGDGITAWASLPYITLTPSAASSLYATIASPTFTGTVSGITKSMVGLGNVDNIADANKPISTATQTALDLKAPLASPTFTGTVSLDTGATLVFEGATANNFETTFVVADPTADRTLTLPDSTGTLATQEYVTAEIGTHNSDTTSVHGITDTAELATKAYADTASSNAVSTAIGTHEADTLSVHGITDTSLLVTTTGNQTLTNKTITTPAGLVKSDVGLGNVDNTSDANKPISTATQTALDAKASLSGATFTGAVSGTSLTLSGNLTINGTTTTINSTELSVDDKNIVLGDVATPSDSTADGGGITLKGATDKTFNWVDATDSWTSSEHINLASGKGLKVNGTAVISSTAGGFIFTDGTQTLEGVPSRTPITQKTASYTLSALTERDNLIEMSSASALTLTIPTDATLNFPIGTSIDVLQTGAGQVTIAAVSGTVTVNATPGLKLRTTWSSATLFKRAANTWVVFGDLTA